MVFKKGDPFQKECSDKGHEAYRENAKEKGNVLVQAITGGFDAYNTLLAELKKKDSEELTPNEKLYMEKIEKMAEFAIPKLARTETKIDADVTLKGFDVVIKK